MKRSSPTSPSFLVAWPMVLRMRMRWRMLRRRSLSGWKRLGSTATSFRNRKGGGCFTREARAEEFPDRGPRSVRAAVWDHERADAALGREFRIQNSEFRKRGRGSSTAGYVTVTPDLHFLVSGKIKEEFENGRDYYRLNGEMIRLPENPAHRPMAEALGWHNEERYLG